MALPFDPIEEAARNWRSRGWEAVDAMRAATNITRAHQILHARVDAALAPLQLNFSRFEVLALLSFTRHGELPMGKIGARLQVHPASITNTIARLETDGLVERRPHPSDGRTILARILTEGRARAEAGQEALAAVGYGLDGLDLDDFSTGGEALTRYREINGDFARPDPQ